ncbi:TetR family transcriptional regulator C-terminal domain-containing protein [Microbispora sp. CA-102843]|uniref:TetR family transcriptional regulator C-terminal domain-containing protein n=1 Tax=Microbispora sp. CA-102843 TaxID=3239952 RepID=UPI003D93BDA6
MLTAVLGELIPADPATEAHMRVRQSFNALALADQAIAAKVRLLYDDFHRQMADLVRRDQQAGHIPAALDAREVAAGLVALAEGLAFYVLIDVTPAATARERLSAAIADLYASAGPSSLDVGEEPRAQG